MLSWANPSTDTLSFWRDTFLWAAPSDGTLESLLSDWSGPGHLRPVGHWRYRFLTCTAMPKERLLGERRPDAHYRQSRRRWGPNACVYHICAPLYQAVATYSREELLGSGNFLGVLLRQSLSQNT
jgi:hypothetical protein